jgi:hypothetical protein
MHTILRLASVAIVLGCVGSLAGCYAETGTEPVVTSSAEIETDGYEPAYYDGYVVYYDGGGRPYYYNRGAVVWVSPRSPHYVGLVNHWHTYGPAYGRWYAHTGPRYHSYRVQPGYHAYHGYHSAPARRAPPAHHRR